MINNDLEREAKDRLKDFLTKSQKRGTFVRNVLDSNNDSN